MKIVLMIPGQGSQYPGMGQSIYAAEPVFRSALEDFLTAYGPGRDELRAAWQSGARTDLAPGHIAQPLLFGLGYATAETLRHQLIDHELVLLGHSVGELAAATVAGVFELPLAAELMRIRASALRTAPPGGMVGVRANPELVQRLLGAAGLSRVIGAINAPEQCVVSAAESELAPIIATLRAAEISCMKIPANQPFHSPLMAPCAQEQRYFLRGRVAELN
ncbi:MAG: acyltransferase domain-containing protein, partial [Angustibacter sp.]